MSKNPRTTSIIIVLLIILLAFVGAVSGLLIAWNQPQPWLWVAVGSIVGILVGGLVGFAFARSATPRSKKPIAVGQTDSRTRRSLHKTQPLLGKVYTSDGIPLGFNLFLAFGNASAMKSQSGAEASGTDELDVKDLVVTAVSAATKETVKLQTADEVFSAHVSENLDKTIAATANAMLAQWDQQISYLVIEDITLPDEIRAAELAGWIQDTRAEIERQTDAVRTQMMQKLISVVEHTYTQAKAASPRKRKQHGQVLAQVLEDIKNQAAPKGMWPDALEDLLAGIA